MIVSTETWSQLSREGGLEASGAALEFLQGAAFDTLECVVPDGIVSPFATAVRFGNKVLFYPGYGLRHRRFLRRTSMALGTALFPIGILNRYLVLVATDGALFAGLGGDVWRLGNTIAEGLALLQAGTDAPKQVLWSRRLLAPAGDGPPRHGCGHEESVVGTAARFVSTTDRFRALRGQSRTLLLAAGWYPGRTLSTATWRDESQATVGGPLTKGAASLLAAVGGLAVTPRLREGCVAMIGDEITFDPSGLFRSEPFYSGVSEQFGGEASPVARVGGQTVWVTEHDGVFVGWVDCGDLWKVGTSLLEGLEELLNPTRPPTMVLEGGVPCAR